MSKPKPKSMTTRTTNPGHVWLCSAAVSIGGIGTISRRWINKPEFAGRYALCEFNSADFEEAYRHADEHAGAHWVYEYPRGDRSDRPLRNMHGSDGGGAYVNDFSGTWHPAEGYAAGAWF